MWTQRRAASSGVGRIRLLLRSSSFGRYLQTSESCGEPPHTCCLHSLSDSVKSYNTFHAVGENYRESYLEQDSYPIPTSRLPSRHEVRRRINTLTSDVSSLIRPPLHSSQLGLYYSSYGLSKNSPSSARYFGTASYSPAEDQTPPDESGDNSVAGASSKTWYAKLSAILATGPLTDDGRGSAIVKTPSPARSTNRGPEENLRRDGERGRKFTPFSVCQRLRAQTDIDSAWRYFLWVGKQEGYKHGEDTYNTMIQRLCGASRFSTAFELLDAIRAQGFSLTPTTCVTVLRSLASANMYGKAHALFRDLGLYGCNVNLAVYNSYMALLVKAGQCNLLEETFHVMVGRNISPDVYSYNNLLNGLRRAGQPEKVLRYFGEMRQKGYEANTVTYNIALRSLGMLGRNDEVVELFCEMSRKGVASTSFTYSALLHNFRADATSKSTSPWTAEAHDHRHLMWTLCRRKDFASAVRMLRELEARGDKIPLTMYNLFAVFLLDAGKVDTVRDLFQGMKATGCEPDAVTYTAAIDAACRSRNADEAFSLRKEMVEKGHTVGVTTWNMVIDVASKAGLVETAFELFSEMQKTCKPDVYTFNILTHILCNLEKTEDALSCLRQGGIRADGITSCERGALEFFQYMKRVTAPDFITYQTLIHAMCRAGNLQECQDLVQEMEERGLRPGVVIYSRVLKLLGKSGKVDKAWRLFLRMQSSNMPDEVTYATMIKTLARGGSFGKATKLLEEMEGKGFAPNVFAYTSLLENLVGAKRFEEAEKLMKQMVRKRCHLDRIGYNSLINTYCKVGKVAQAYSIFLQGIDDGCLPDTNTYNSLIRGYFRSRNTNEALDMYNVMKDMGSKPDGETLEILIRGLEKAGRKDELKQVLEEMRQLGIVPPVSRSVPLDMERTKHKQIKM